MRPFRTCLRGLWEMSVPVRGWIVCRVLLGFVRIAASLTFVWLCQSLVDIACGNSSRPIAVFIAALLFVMAVQTSTGVLGSYLDGKMSVKGEIELRKSLFAHVLRSSWRGREVFHSGDAVNRMEEDIKTVVDIVCVRFPDAIITSVQLVAASVFLLRRSPSLVWILILLMVFAVLGSKLFFKTIRSLTAKIRNTESRIQSFLQENIQQRMLVLTLLGVDRVVNRFDDLQGELSSDVAERLRFNAIARSFMNFGFTSGYAVAFIWGILNIRSGAITYGIMTALLQLAGQIQRPVAELGKNLPSFINSLTSVERLMDISQLELEEPSEELRFDKAPGIAVNDLSFSFPEDESLVIENLNFDFKPGTMTVITGVTGAGKSTLVKLILGLLKPVQGSVVMYSDSQNAKCGSGTRCNIMYVPQGGSLMSGTIRENLALACPGMTDEQAAEVLHLAAADFVFSLSHGLDTVCAEAGNGLSEGQAQRIAIARALLCPGTVLILDESTSALDPETEQILLDNLSSAYKGKKTIIFVSHREAVSHYADASLSL